jgi:putative transposase
MLDHVHLLLSPSHNLSVIAFVAAFKSLSTRLAWEHKHEDRLWQARFFDHFLRHDEAVERVVEYVLNNPVRAGMVADWRGYPFSGALVYSL